MKRSNLQLTQGETVTLHQEGCRKTGSHLPVLSFVGMEEEFPNVMHQNRSWLYHRGQILFNKKTARDQRFYFIFTVICISLTEKRVKMLRFYKALSVSYKKELSTCETFKKRGGEKPQRKKPESLSENRARPGLVPHVSPGEEPAQPLAFHCDHRAHTSYSVEWKQDQKQEGSVNFPHKRPGNL